MSETLQRLADLMANQNIRIVIENHYENVDASIFVKRRNGDEFVLAAQAINAESFESAIGEALENL